MKTRVILMAMAWTVSALLTGCGGGGGSTAPAASTANYGAEDAGANIVALRVGNPTEIQPGYEVVDASEDAVIDIEVKGDQKTMTLISGEANLLMPN